MIWKKFQWQWGPSSMILDIWRSFMRISTWVQIWIVVILVPVNIAALLFWTAPYGAWIAVLAIGGMLPNLWIMMKERGLSKLMALPHLVIWTPLVVLIVWVVGTQELTTPHFWFLCVLLIVDIISLGFDVPDFLKWWRGDREIA